MRAINSVLQQTYTNIEIIVVDDCSVDSTVNVINTCGDSRVHIIRLPQNHGANYARNQVIEKARREFIAFQDSDDEWLEDKLDKQIGCNDSNEGCLSSLSGIKTQERGIGQWKLWKREDSIGLPLILRLYQSKEIYFIIGAMGMNQLSIRQEL